nr:ATP-binding domain-containing protein [Pelistega europaea]
MCWFEKNTRLWSATSQRIYDRINRAAWDALKEDARVHQYTLAQWHERANTLHKRWSEREGIRFVTVSQSKGREYDSVLVYHADQQGFGQAHSELARHQFYIAITRAKKHLSLYLPSPALLQDKALAATSRSIVPHFHDSDFPSLSSQKPQQTRQPMSPQKHQALVELKHIKEQLKKRLIIR